MAGLFGPKWQLEAADREAWQHGRGLCCNNTVDPDAASPEVPSSSSASLQMSHEQPIYRPHVVPSLLFPHFDASSVAVLFPHTPCMAASRPRLRP